MDGMAREPGRLGHQNKTQPLTGELCCPARQWERLNQLTFHMSPRGKACETVATVGHRPVPLGWFNVFGIFSYLFTAKRRR